jgi:hypothetical protein
MIVLSPGVMVTNLKPIIKNVDPTKEEKLKQKKKGEQEKIYPIEIYIGGTIASIGIEQPYFSSGSTNGTVTFFYKNADQQKTWYRYFQRATGCYNIHSFYQYYKEHE